MNIMKFMHSYSDSVQSMGSETMHAPRKFGPLEIEFASSSPYSLIFKGEIFVDFEIFDLP